MYETIFGLYASADFCIQKWGSERWKEKWDSLVVPSRLGWKGSLIVLLSITVIVMFFHAVAHIKKREQEMEKELSDERAKAERPQVIVTCDWISAVSTMRGRNSGQLILKVLNDVPALDVCVQEIEFPNSTKARFEVVRIVEKSQAQSVPCSIEKRDEKLTSSMIMTFESCVKRMSDFLPKNDLCVGPIKVIAQYRDMYGRYWQSISELTYNVFTEEGDMQYIDILPMVKPPLLS